MNFLILITTFAGFYLAPALETSGFRTFRVACALVGTLLVAGSTNALNQFFERSFVRARSFFLQRTLRISEIERIPRQLLAASIIYFPAVFALIMLNKP